MGAVRRSVASRRLRIAFDTHRSNAHQRGIDFLLTYDEWLRIWKESGHLAERGACTGGYVMARYGDIGPYAVGNVRIILHADNTREAWTGRTHSSETRAKLSSQRRGRPLPVSMHEAALRANLGKKRSPEIRAKISAAMRGNTNFLGHTHSKETRERLSRAMLGNINGLRRRIPLQSVED